MKRFEQKAAERHERIKAHIEEAEVIYAFVDEECHKFDMMIKQSELTVSGLSKNTGNLELF